MKPRGRSSDGFSLIELLVSMSLMLIVLAGVFATLHPAEGVFLAEPEAADAQQRLRLAADTVARELRLAGAGAPFGAMSGPLAESFAPVLPFRRGRRNTDPPATFTRSTITLLRLAPGAAQTTIASAVPAASSFAQLNADPGCPPADPSCGFDVGSEVAIYDGTGAYDTFTVTGLSGRTLALDHNMVDTPTVYAPGVSKIAAVNSRTFFLKTGSDGISRLMQYNGAAGADVAIADHVVALGFEYYGEPSPPRLYRPLAEPQGPWTTYGPRPPAPGVQATAYPPGENCVFARDAAGLVVPRLAVLGGGSTGLVPLGAADLTDGPWCPDASSPNRYDADLLRIRMVAVTLRVEAASSAVRGPAGVLFTRGGTSAGGYRFVPDQETRLVVSPRNMSVAP
jgi:prepilin-type N-terminal cleavage/methylation domain-containing protein